MIENSQKIYDVIVVGGGASGLMAAGRAAERGKSVLLIEKNKKLGEKLKITGGGRCNITNAEEDERIFNKNYGENEQFMYSLFAKFGMKDTFTFFESRGLPLVTQARKRVFPETEKSLDVYFLLESYIQKGKVIVRSNSPVTKVNTENKKIISVSCGGNEFFAKSFIFATGGVSHPETGSTGDGFNWLKDLGHTVSDPTPSIVPLAVEEEWVKSLAGVSLSHMKITFFVEGKKKFAKLGKVLFTHFGLSGPLILNAANAVGDLLYDGIVTATIDAFPDTDLGALDKRITLLFDNNKNKMLKNVFKEIAPEGTSAAILSLVNEYIDPDTKVHSIKKDQRKILINLLKKLPLTITGLMGYDRAVISDGGVPLAEIDMKTMRSKKIENLFVTGDLLHVNRPSGGYGLQLCWSTGYVAGDSA